MKDVAIQPAAPPAVRRPDAQPELARLKQANAAVTEALRSIEAMAWLDVEPSRDPVEVCQVLVGKIRDTLDVGHVGVFLMNPQAMQFDMALSVPVAMNERIRSEFELQLSAGVIGWTVRERRLVAAPSLSEAAGVAKQESVIVFPISTPRQVWGLVLCFTPHPHEELPQNMLRLLSIVGNHIGMAVENASLIRALSEQNKNLEKIVAERSAELIARKRDLQEAYDKLLRLDSAKDDFLALVAHELRTPLTSILSFSEFLAEDDLSKAEIKEFATSVRQEATRLHHLVNDVLDLAKMEAGKLSYHYSEGDLGDLAQLCISNMGAAAQSHRITLRLDRDARPCVATLAHDRIQQVIMNMLSNAIKFSDDGAEVIIATRNLGDSVTLSVRDFGVGIAARDIPKVFNKFEQVENVKQGVKGTGFGMPISKTLIEVGHKGKMWVESEGRGKGSTFYFTLPKRRPAAGQAPAGPQKGSTEG